MVSFLTWLWLLDKENRRQRRIGLLMAVLFLLLIAPAAAVLTWMFLNHGMFYEHWFLLFVLTTGLFAWGCFIVILSMVWLFEYHPEVLNADDKILDKIKSAKHKKTGGL